MARADRSATRSAPRDVRREVERLRAEIEQHNQRYYVLDDRACMVGAALVMSRFLANESCGQCPPCKLGSTEITNHLARLETGRGDVTDVESIGHWLERVTDGNRCFLAVQERLVVGSIMNAFADEVDDHLQLGRCPRPRAVPLPKLVDLSDGVATYADSLGRIAG